MNRRRLPALLVCAVLLGAVAAPAPAQALTPEGTWAGKRRFDGGTVKIRYSITRLQVGRRAGTTRYRFAKHTCRGRLRLVSVKGDRYRFRDRRVRGKRRYCTTGDRITMRRVGKRLRVTVRAKLNRPPKRFRFRLRLKG